MADPIRKTLGRWLSRVVDPLVVGSFDRTGHRIHSLTFDPADLDVDLSGRRFVVTGANSGIGFETAAALAERGARVVLACRSLERGQAALDRIADRTGSRCLELERLDVSDLADVRRFAARQADRPVDVLIHNAGVLPGRRQETDDGLELCFATHVAGPFLLTRLLQSQLEASSDGRVIWVSSGGMYTRRLQVDDPQWRERDYDGVLAYAETKRAQVVLSELFAETFAGTRVVSNAMHPGWADTPAVRSSLPLFHRVTRLILREPAEGADTVVWLAASAAGGRHSGEFWFDRARRRTHWLPGTRESNAERRALWALCREATRDFAPVHELDVARRDAETITRARV
jgi:NAD(P)-dependent dehydrogenase (short-subunit alcohol dehydrogenase family)